MPGVAEVLRGSPKAGTGEGAARASAFSADVRSDAVSLVNTAAMARAVLLQLESEAVARVSVRLTEGVLPGAVALEVSAARAVTAFNRFAAGSERIDRQADALSGATAANLAGIASAMAEVEGICAAIVAPFWYSWDTPPHPAMPQPRAESVSPEAAAAGAGQHLLFQVYEVRWRSAALAWGSDVSEVSSAVNRWDDLVAERHHIERTLVSALDDSPLGHLLTLGAGTPGGWRRAVAAGLTRGPAHAAELAAAVDTEHPLLAGIFPTRDGSAVWGDPPSPELVVAWWEGLREAERAELIAAVPFVIGNLPGVPAASRDAANRRSLEFFRAQPQLLGPDQLRLVAAVQRILDVERAQQTASPEIQLLSFNLLEAVPMVAVAYGDLDAVTHATWQVGGMNTDAHTALPVWDVASRNLHDGQSASLRRGGDLTPGVITWLSYDTPALPPDPAVFGSEVAAAGAARLALEIDGLHTSRANSPAGVPVTNVIAHSYGATVASIALTRTRHAVDSFVMLGAAGLDTAAVPTIEALNVKEAWPGQRAVFATNAAADRIAPAGAGLAERALPTGDARAPLLLEQRSPVYGGVITFPAEGDPARGLKATDGHSAVGQGARAGIFGASASAGHGYEDRDTQALAVTAEITTQTIGPDTRALFSVTREQRVSSYFDAQSGLKVSLRVPLHGRAAQ